jgi:plastocyanin
MVAFFLFPSAMADQRLYQAGYMAPSSYQGTYAAPQELYGGQVMYAAPEMYATPEYAAAQYAYPAAVAYEQEAPADWSNVALLAVAGAVVGAAIGSKAKGKKATACGNPYCTCGSACGCGAGCQCGVPKPVSMLGVSGTEQTVMDKVRTTALAALVSVGLMTSPLVANAVDVKLGSDGGQLVFVPDEVTIKAGDSVTWKGNKGMPHNVVFDEEAVPDGTALDKINHEDMINEEGESVTSKFEKPGTYAYYCEPHRGAGMNGTVIVK